MDQEFILKLASSVIDNNPYVWVSLAVGVILFLLLFSFSYTHYHNFRYAKRHAFSLGTVVFMISTILVLSNASGSVYPVISADVETQPTDVRVKQMSSNEVLISWRTEFPVMQFIRYGSLDGVWQVGMGVAGDVEVTDHNVYLTNLSADTEYRFEIHQSDKAFTSAVGFEFEFVTTSQ